MSGGGYVYGTSILELLLSELDNRWLYKGSLKINPIIEIVKSRTIAMFA